MRKSLVFVMVIIFAAVTASAQTEGDLKRYFEGRQVTLKIDMPATKDGVNVYPEREQPLNYSEYANRLKRNGTSVRRGEEIMITKIKVKDKHIEFQLGGGGYGTAGDETDSSVNVPTAGKSRREKNLEDEYKRETDPGRRRRMKEELDDLRHRREREDQLNRTIAAEAEESRRARIEQKALQGGSRFNIHFTVMGSRVLTSQAVVEALRKYVDFSDAQQDEGGASVLRQISYEYAAPGSRKIGVVRVGSPTTYLKLGLTTKDVLQVLGEPARISKRVEDGMVVTTYEFRRGGERVLVADFVRDTLIRSRTESGEQIAQGTR
jgi:hypothetical protein